MAVVETEVTAVDVAREFVATKIAVVQAFEMLSGTSPTLREPEASAVSKWTHESPVSITDADGWLVDAEPLYERASEIATQIMRAVGAYFTRCA
jgi:hypothetical protein